MTKQEIIEFVLKTYVDCAKAHEETQDWLVDYNVVDSSDALVVLEYIYTNISGENPPSLRSIMESDRQ